jgi:DnaJ-class molecular chaperone
VEYKDYYKILGVKRGASEAEIKAAYRRMARKHHPDVNPGDKAAAERFKEINEAYEVLSKPDLRARYDGLGGIFGRFGGMPPTGPGTGTFGGTGRTTGAAGGGQPPFRRPGQVDSSRFSDFFHSIFGQAAGTPRGGSPQKGADIEQPIQVSLEETATGGQRVFTIRGQDRCGKCLGTGESPPGKECETCHGSGVADYTRRLEVRVPPGVREGSRIRIPREGNPGANGGEKGDLYLVVSMKQHPTFRREGDDLHLDVDVPYLRLILGGEVAVPTLSGRVQLTVPPHTQNGRSFRLGGLGLPHLKEDGKGDLYAHVRAVLPSQTSGTERAHYEALDRLAGRS